MQVKEIAKSFAKKFLLSRGYQLLAEDFVTNESIVELIVKDPEVNEIVFVPVRITKYRQFFFNDEKKEYLERRKIIRTMKWFLTKHGLLKEEVRVDLAEVSVDNKKANIRYSKKVLY